MNYLLDTNILVYLLQKNKYAEEVKMGLTILEIG